MSAEKLITDAEKLLKPYVVGAFSRTPVGVEAVVGREDLPAAVNALIDARWGYLSAITGLDHPWPTAAKPAPKPAEAPAEPPGPTEDRLEALYQFVSGAVIATLRVSVAYHDATLPTVCPIIPSATLYERELQEMFGIVVQGTPEPRRLLLPDDWPEHVYPLRKSFKGLEG
jgi:NADH:ubiquinone oxidoreductase subunit C